MEQISTNDRIISLWAIKNHWEISGMKQAIEDNIKLLEAHIFSITKEWNEKMFTEKDLNISKREILVRLKNLPDTLLEKAKLEWSSFDEWDILKEFINYNW